MWYVNNRSQILENLNFNYLLLCLWVQKNKLMNILFIECGNKDRKGKTLRSQQQNKQKMSSKHEEGRLPKLTYFLHGFGSLV